MEMVFAYITTKDKAEARRIGRGLIEKKLAACVNILDGMESYYWWEGKIDESQEAVLIAKTEKRLIEALIETVKTTHSYSVPCVLAIPVVAGNPDYIRWLGENLR